MRKARQHSGYSHDHASSPSKVKVIIIQHDDHCLGGVKKKGVGAAVCCCI